MIICGVVSGSESEHEEEQINSGMLKGPTGGWERRIRCDCPACAWPLEYSAPMTDIPNGQRMIRCPACLTVSPLISPSRRLYNLYKHDPKIADKPNSLRSTCEQWSITQVIVFMKKLNMDTTFLKALNDCNIDGRNLLSLTENDVKVELGQT